MKALDLALKAGRLRQSPVTSFIHHCDHAEHTRDGIPTYENFCFALTLFRTKTAENGLEAKALLEKLFAFQTQDGFPIYLHEYPICHSRKHSARIALVAHLLLKEFSAVLGEKLRGQLQMLASFMSIPQNPQTPQDWAEFLVHSQHAPLDQAAAFQLWETHALCFTGPQKQRGGEPAVTLFDLILGEWTGRYSQRALQDSPIHLQASLIFPHTITLPPRPQSWQRQFWGDGNPTHSAVFQTKGSFLEENLIELPAADVQDEVESSFFFNRHEGAVVTVNGTRATTFQPGEPITIETGGKKFEIVFSLQEGSGKFWGHIYFGNRPEQMALRHHEAFDWHLALRTIDRSERCLIKVVCTTA